MNELFFRNCPKCGKIITHKNKKGCKYADRHGKQCRNCGRDSVRVLDDEVVYHRVCSNIECKRIIQYKNRKGYLAAINRNSEKCIYCTRKGSVGWSRGLTKTKDERVANIGKGVNKRLQEYKEKGIIRESWCKGKTMNSDERVRKSWLKSQATKRERIDAGLIKPWNLGKTWPWSDKCSPNPPNLGKKLSEEAKDRIRVKRTERFIEQGIGPSYNKNTVSYFTQLNLDLGWNGIFAQNPKEYYIKGLGYWVDYYEPDKNIVIEFYEKHHNQPKKIVKDLVRQNKIIKKLNCKFYIIREWENKPYADVIIKLRNLDNG